VVRHVRRTGETIVVTVDGEAAVEIAPAAEARRPMTAAEVAVDRALTDAILRLARTDAPFDAIDLIRDGRR
jgi:antitoxin (DNA-binding transcriptional repressor) of toxin-antitoxin stability system